MVTNAGGEKLANAELLRRSYDGYSGTITTFLEPRCDPTNVAVVADDVYPTRDGSYLIEGVTTTYGGGGRDPIAELRYNQRAKLARRGRSGFSG